jgi:hypothetical protein
MIATRPANCGLAWIFAAITASSLASWARIA